MRVILIVCLLLGLSTLGQAGDMTERTYPKAFETSGLPKEHVDWIKLFDYLAFAPKQERFISLRPELGSRNSGYVLRVYSRLGLIRELSYLASSTNSVFNFPSPNPGGDADPALNHLVFFPVSALDNPFSEQLKNRIMQAELGVDLEQLRAEMHVLDDGRCRVWRNVENYRVQRSLVLVYALPEANMSATDQRIAAACVNRGFYYHIGYNNALNMRVDELVRAHPSSGKLFMNSKFKTLFPYLLTQKDLTGAQRTDVLTAILNDLEQRYER